MKKVIALACLLFCGTPAAFAADSGFTQSIQGWSLQGNLIYDLYDSAQTHRQLSEVNLPQNQTLSMDTLKYTFPGGRQFVRVQFGLSPDEFKGVGYDADWTTQGTAALSNYGNMDSYGHQKMMALDYGLDTGRTQWFAGWEQRESMNQLQNVVYHVVNGTQVNNQTQADNGSILNGTVRGFHIGLEHAIPLSSKLQLNTSLAVGLANQTAHGEWYNHSPAWIWDDGGKPIISENATIMLNYKVNAQSSAYLGYSYFLAKAKNETENINTGSGYQATSEPVDLTYRQQGVTMGLTFAL